MKKILCVILILVILIGSFVVVSAIEPIFEYPPLYSFDQNLYPYWLIVRPRDQQPQYTQNTIILVFSDMPITVEDVGQGKFRLCGQAKDRDIPIEGHTWSRFVEEGDTAWRVPDLNAQGYVYGETYYFGPSLITGTYTINSVDDIYYANHDIKVAKDGEVTNETFMKSSDYQELTYKMKVFDLEANAIMEYQFETVPTYGGVGVDSLKLYYSGNLVVNGTEAIPVNNQLFRVSKFYSKNFTIKDSSGRTVIPLKTNGYMALKSTANPDTQGVMLDSWTGSAKVVFNNSDNFADGSFSFENVYDKNMYQIKQLLVTSGLVVFKTFKPELYTQTGKTLDAQVDPDSVSQPVDPYVFDEEKPDPTQYEDSVYGKINYALDMIGYYISMPFRFILRLLGELVTFLADTVTETADLVKLLAKMFGFLPEKVQVMIGGLFTISALITVWNLKK